MEHELLHEVDENDQVIGTRTRGELHRLGLRHRAVHILVFNSRNELFLQKRSASKDINPGLWDTSAAGHVDLGESYDEAARRELNEELSVDDAPPLQPIFKLPSSPETGWEFIQVYTVKHDGPFRLNADEITEGQWISVTELDDWIEQGGKGLTLSFQSLWQTFQQMNRHNR
jgi:isopentenyl-diphosphate delta-isomerase type 1